MIKLWYHSFEHVRDFWLYFSGFFGKSHLHFIIIIIIHAFFEMTNIYSKFLTFRPKSKIICFVLLCFPTLTKTWSSWFLVELSTVLCYTSELVENNHRVSHSFLHQVECCLLDNHKRQISPELNIYRLKQSILRSWIKAE